MTRNPEIFRRLLRRCLAPLKATPLHPQWLVYRLGRQRELWVASKTTGKVLDIGCADSSIRITLVKAKSYIGLDYLATAAGLYGTQPDVYGDAVRLPFIQATFDSVLLLDVLEHVSEPDLAISEALRVLRPGGCILLTIPFSYPMHDQPYDYQRFTEHGIAYRLSQAGFVNINIKEIGDGIESAAISMALSLSQGSIEALSARNWRITFVPLALLSVPLINILCLLFSCLLPARRFMPSSYYIQAFRQVN